MRKLNSKNQARTDTDSSTQGEDKMSSPNCCNILDYDSFSSGCDVNYVNPVYTFKDDKCFKDDVFFW